MFIDQTIRFDLIHEQLPAAPQRIFEVGVGACELMRSLAGKGYEVSGCEISPEAVENARKTGLGSNVLLATGGSLPVPDCSFDCAITSDVFEHVYPQDRDQFLRELLRITRPGGKIVMTAWFHHTFSFSLFGAFHLLFLRRLPQWYLEHLMIDRPNLAATKQFFENNLQSVFVKEYQGPVNIMLTCVQVIASALVPHFLANKVKSILGMTHVLAKRGDFLGAQTSAVFSGTKSL